jgi:hypothetical protein
MFVVTAEAVTACAVIIKELQKGVRSNCFSLIGDIVYPGQVVESRWISFILDGMAQPSRLEPDPQSDD